MFETYKKIIEELIRYGQMNGTIHTDTDEYYETLSAITEIDRDILEDMEL